MTLYEILGVPPDCSSDVLRQQYRRLLLELHPDKRSSDVSDGRARFEQIQNAYQILADAEQRLKYDQEQQRRHLHTLAHVNVELDEDNDYTCRCGTVVEIDAACTDEIVECPNCSTRVEWRKK